MASGANAAPRPHRRDKPCWRCGYSLRKLPLESRNCPECGLAVRISLSGDPSLHIADQRWLLRLALGAVACAIAVGLPLVVLILTGAVELAPDALTVVAAAMIFLATLACLAGWWLLAFPAGYGLLETPNRLVNVMRGIGSIVVLLCGMMVILPAAQRSVSLSMIVSAFVSFIALQLVHLLCLFRLQSLMSRHTNRRMRKWVLVSTWIAIGGLIMPCVAGGSWEILVPLLEHGRGVEIFRVIIVLTLAQFVWLWLTAAGIFRRSAADAESAWVSD
jgi:hypothetical protein